MKNLLKNWKTTSAGVGLMGHSVIHLVFCIRAGTADELTWNFSIGEFLTGVGLLLAGDSSKSAADHEKTLNELENIKSAVRTGDTAIITKPPEETKKP